MPDARTKLYSAISSYARGLFTTSPHAPGRQPAPEYVGNGMFKGETIEKAAEHWANWCDVRCMTGLSEFLRVVAAHAPTDSRTAPVLAYPPLPRVGAIGYASRVDIESYAKTLTIGPHLPGVRDIALWTTDQMRAYVDADRTARTQADSVCYDYAKQIAESMWATHYKADAPHWESCDSLMGVLSQISNMMCGLSRAPADSVTAPAATPTAASIAWTALRDLTDPLGEAGVKIMGHVRIYAQRRYEAGLTEGRATPPAQAQAGAVPQRWKAVPVNPTPEMWKAAKTVPDPNPPSSRPQQSCSATPTHTHTGGQHEPKQMD